jgi:hypothetical protein
VTRLRPGAPARVVCPRDPRSWRSRPIAGTTPADVDLWRTQVSGAAIAPGALQPPETTRYDAHRRE